METQRDAAGCCTITDVYASSSLVSVDLSLHPSIDDPTSTKKDRLNIDMLLLLSFNLRVQHRRLPISMQSSTIPRLGSIETSVEELESPEIPRSENLSGEVSIHEGKNKSESSHGAPWRFKLRSLQ